MVAKNYFNHTLTTRIKCWRYVVLQNRVMAVKIVLSDNVWTIVSAYAPQVGCDEDTKNASWNELEGVIMKVPHKEKLVLAGDLNGHVGESHIGFERWHG